MEWIRFHSILSSLEKTENKFIQLFYVEYNSVIPLIRWRHFFKYLWITNTYYKNWNLSLFVNQFCSWDYIKCKYSFLKFTRAFRWIFVYRRMHVRMNKKFLFLHNVFFHKNICFKFCFYYNTFPLFFYSLRAFVIYALRGYYWNR